MTKDREVQLPQWFNDLNIGIILHEPQSAKILDVNKRIEELLGYSASEFRKMAVSDFTVPSPRFSQDEAVRRIRAAAKGTPQNFEWQVENATGEVLWIAVTLNVTTIDGSPCVVAEIREITEDRAFERGYRLLNRVFRHNLRNEANVLLGYADQLRNVVEDDEVEEQTEVIIEVASEIGSLSNSIRQIEEIADPNVVRRTRRNLRNMVEDLVQEMQAEYPTADITNNAQSDVHVNAGKGLYYALKHALTNAIQHADSQPPTVSVEVNDEQSNGLCVIRILDRNPPIPDIETEVLDTGEATNSTYHGSGMGLWVMKLCIDALGGDLAFEKRSPKGNVVKFVLPVVSSEYDG